MRNDPFFKFVAAIVLVGVLIALVGPAHTAGSASAAKSPAARVSGEAE